MKAKHDITKPRIFTVPSKPTPKHDEMLLLFPKKADIYKRFFDFKDFNKEDKFIRVKKSSSGNYIDDKTKKCYKFIWDGDWLGDDKEKIHESKEEVDVILLHRNFLTILDWTPEYPIMNKGYYLGSIDLLVKLQHNHNVNIVRKKDIRKKDFTCWNYNQHYNNKTYVLLFEFKPIIKSFSEVLRQVKVYQKYFSDDMTNIIPIVVTYSDISKFKSIFDSQGIKIIQLDKQSKLEGVS